MVGVMTLKMMRTRVTWPHVAARVTGQWHHCDQHCVHRKLSVLRWMEPEPEPEPELGRLCDSVITGDIAVHTTLDSEHSRD